ncbi:YecA family protein [Aliivibrio fischeri]|uniref:SecA, C-motif domain protein n=1 Tax=Aliivibrio fischeri (strain MJ11) TaxID=388396 RepID=B5FFH7_ALIFM|nr:SEC-C metal-binding domain-containing protein [Aliivibrio fischeri]ACH67071.1 SecA, C-motif domain protein [Aliivibrio fischeri MJ11]MCE4937418.1 SEC-C domain-containing protein [Aliivibrio fischeri]OCH02261.1 prepilin peptidase [Aliivibrio fischeri]OCH04784.1 prepilin peptidase [Aliivibrio fischeri]OCH05630.1 prepilin peptidase [Aliivibrio fischeri]
MKYQLISLSDVDLSCTNVFLEGAVLAANMATKPLEPEVWLNGLVGTDVTLNIKNAVIHQIEQQYTLLKRNEYEIATLIDIENVDLLADFAEGFMSVWPLIEDMWAEVSIGDGTSRMLSALLTTLMLALDEEQTQAQMKEAGIDTPPTLKGMLPQLDMMILEVAMAADELQIGYKGQKVNPYKNIGRNDACPCNSGKKFKQCCGK